MNTFTINRGKLSYNFNTDIPEAILTPFVDNALAQAKTIYKNWYRGAREIYGSEIKTNPADYVSIFQAGLPNEESMNQWVESTALKNARNFINAMKQI